MEQDVLLQGGIGDFLQCIPFINANKNSIRCTCVTHLKSAEQFFKAIGINPENIYFFKTEKEKINILNALPRAIQYLNCPRTKYFENNPFNVEEPLFRSGKPVVGIHINGSSYAINIQKTLGLVVKSIPAKVIKELISENYNVIVFGLKEEIYPIGLKESDNLKLITDENPAKSLAYVRQCNAVVASDSGIKTMSSMLRIPTLVWLGDYKDPLRDKMFIDPYVNDGVMRVFRYKDVNAQFNEGIRQAKRFLKDIL